MKRTRLFTPGPVMVKPEWMEIMSQPFMHHRGQEFASLMQRLQPKLQYTFQTQMPVMVMAGSGTLAMEAAVLNIFAAGEHVLVVSIGYFGEVFAKIAERNGLKVTKLTFSDGMAADPQAIAQALAADATISGILVTHHDTATGMVNDLHAIGAIAKAHDVIVVVDAISGLVIHELKMDEWGLDCVLTASQKSYFLPPGLALCACSQRAWQRIEAQTPRSYYQDFSAYKQMWETKNQTPFTPPIPLLIGLELACDAIIKESLPQLQARHEVLRQEVQHRLEALGFTCPVKQLDAQGNVLVAVEMAQGAKALTEHLEQVGIMVAPGQGAQIDTVFRVGCIGELSQADFECLYTELAQYQAKKQ
ncbi:MAG: pyridoxal-phosphate-dependent aminotransferase family protein [Culicoidibacterales bacterium]